VTAGDVTVATVATEAGSSPPDAYDVARLRPGAWSGRLRVIKAAIEHRRRARALLEDNSGPLDDADVRRGAAGCECLGRVVRLVPLLLERSGSSPRVVAAVKEAAAASYYWGSTEVWRRDPTSAISATWARRQ
jgi:hypothetical protein